MSMKKENLKFFQDYRGYSTVVTDLASQARDNARKLGKTLFQK